MNVAGSNDNIIKLLGIESLPDERKIDLVEKASALVEKRLFLRLLNSLNDKKRKEFENLLDAENQEAISLFVQQNVPEMPQWFNDEINRVKEELVTLNPPQ